jgi:hypothetical protein
MKEKRAAKIIYWMIRSILVMIGAAAILVAEYLPYLVPHGVDVTAYRILLATLGSILAGTVVIEGAFQLRFHRQIQNEVTALSNNILTLQETVMIVKGAIDAGLTAVYATRGECLSKIKELLEQKLQSVRNNTPDENIHIHILGISLGDFLCPHGSLQPTFRELLKHKRFKISVAILKDGCSAALYRAAHEELGKFHGLCGDGSHFSPDKTNKDIMDIYNHTKCHDELKTATDYLTDLVERHQIDRDEPAKDKVVSAGLEAYTYKAHPMAFIFVMDDEMFIESYHLAGRGGEAPILQVSKFKKQAQQEKSKLYEIYMGHFESVINRSERIVVPSRHPALPQRESAPQPEPVGAK